MVSRSRRSARQRAQASRLLVEVIGGAPGAPRASLPALGRWLVRAAPRRAAGDVTVFLTTDSRIRALNRRYRRKDRVTDVLSFPAWNAAPGTPSTSLRAGRHAEPGLRHPFDFAQGGPAPGTRFLVGDVVIAVGRARRQARAARHSLDTELRILALHGLLHLLGHDHETDDGEMARLERRLRHKAGLREGLIERARVAAGGRVAEGALRGSGAGGER
jgi:probable rRNA maturation factor